MPTSYHIRIVQYAGTMSHDSPAPHSYYPTMGRRQRRQPVNPPPPFGVRGVSKPGAIFLDPQSAEFSNPLMKSKFRPPAALAGPLGFGAPFASILCILRCFGPRRCSEFEVCTTCCFHPLYFNIYRASEVLRIKNLATVCLRPMYFAIDRASDVLRIRILDASGPGSSIHYANNALWELRI